MCFKILSAPTCSTAAFATSSDVKYARLLQKQNMMVALEQIISLLFLLKHITYLCCLIFAQSICDSLFSSAKLFNLANIFNFSVSLAASSFASKQFFTSNLRLSYILLRQVVTQTLPPLAI